MTEAVGWPGPFPKRRYTLLSIHLCPRWLQLCPCHCAMMPCVWVGPGAVLWGYTMDLLSVCLSVCPSVCLSSQASCVTALHPVSSAPVLTGHRQSWSPLTASSPHSVSPTTAPGPQHCHRGRPPACPPACPPTLWPLEPNAGPRGPEDSSGPSPPAHPPACQELTLSGSYVTAQPLALPVRRASGACSGKRSKTWSHVVSQSC